MANVTAQYVKNAGEVKELLTRQVSSSVRWQQSVEAMIADGVDTFIEIGPGKTQMCIRDRSTGMWFWATGRWMNPRWFRL